MVLLVVQRDDDTVLVSMYISKAFHNQRYNRDTIRQGFSIIKQTVEGEEPLRLKNLAVKKMARSRAPNAIVDIRVYHINDCISIPFNYTSLEW